MCQEHAGSRGHEAVSPATKFRQVIDGGSFALKGVMNACLFAAVGTSSV